MALAEVVVCAVGRVVTLPAVEITAQATALLVLVMLSAAEEDNGRESPLFCGAPGQPAETVSLTFSGRGVRGRGLERGAELWDSLSAEGVGLWKILLARRTFPFSRANAARSS